MIKYYVLKIEGGTESELIGPYKTCKGRDNAARRLRNSGDEEDGIFWLDQTVDRKGVKLNTGSYTHAFMKGEL
jgi:hypothetical protein